MAALPNFRATCRGIVNGRPDALARDRAAQPEYDRELIARVLTGFATGNFSDWDDIALMKQAQLLREADSLDAAGVHTVRRDRAAQGERWYLGALNDGLFIINAPPSPCGADIPPDWGKPPTMVLNVVGLSQEHAQAIVDAHNTRPPGTPNVVGPTDSTAVPPVAGDACNCGAAPTGDADQTRHSADCTSYAAGDTWFADPVAFVVELICPPEPPPAGDAQARVNDETLIQLANKCGGRYSHEGQRHWDWSLDNLRQFAAALQEKP
jgi:hypothetical protein